MNKPYEVPTGWTRRGRVEVEVDEKYIVVSYRRPFSSVQDEISRDAIAYIFFHSLDELTDWLRWWFS